MTGQDGQLASILEVAEKFTFENARTLSRLYDDDATSIAGRARKKADASLSAAGLNDLRVNWLRKAGNAVVKAQAKDPWDPTHDEPWRWATQTVLDAVRAVVAAPYLTPEESAALDEPLRAWRESRR